MRPICGRSSHAAPAMAAVRLLLSPTLKAPNLIDKARAEAHRSRREQLSGWYGFSDEREGLRDRLLDLLAERPVTV